MDTSETYIKMCEQAEEIQHHEPQGGDFYYARGGVVILPMKEHIKDFCTYHCLYLIDSEDEIWLPHQDQLQGMLSLNLWPLNHRFSLWLYYQGCNGLIDLHVKHEHEFTSMEQLWLAFVMKERYGKFWDGANWAAVKE